MPNDLGKKQEKAHLKRVMGRKCSDFRTRADYNPEVSQAHVRSRAPGGKHAKVTDLPRAPPPLKRFCFEADRGERREARLRRPTDVSFAATWGVTDGRTFAAVFGVDVFWG